MTDSIEPLKELARIWRTRHTTSFASRYADELESLLPALESAFNDLQMFLTAAHSARDAFEGDVDRLEAEIAALKEDRNKLMGQVQELVEHERLAVASALRDVSGRIHKLAAESGEDDGPFISKLGDEVFAMISDADQKALDAHDAEVEHKGSCWMLEEILANLRGYPDHGGDIQIMAEVKRIVSNTLNEAIERIKDSEAHRQYGLYELIDAINDLRGSK